MDAIFAKTAKGHAEITTKAGGLTPRIRRVLIFIDGKRTVEDLRSMLTADDLQITLGRLEGAPACGAACDDQFHGSRSSSRLILWSWMRPRMSAR